MIERMSESRLTLIQVVKGDDAGGVVREGLSEAQRTGRACLVCQGTDDVSRHVGWVDGVSVRVHTYHLEQYQHGETLRPGRHRA
jgi:hypothetical protein